MSDIITKVCKICSKEKLLSEFGKHKECLYGVQTTCKLCKNSKEKDYRLRLQKQEKESLIGGLKVCCTCNEEKSITDFSKKSDMKDGLMRRCKKCVSEHHNNTKDSLKEGRKIYYENNKKVINDYKNEWSKKRRKEDDFFKLKSGVSSTVRSSFKHACKGEHRKESKTVDILGCSVDKFKLYIESQFLNWMTWDNYGNVCETLEYNCSWDLDHIIPASFAKNEEEIYLLNHWSNFQPLCSKVNRDIKRDNITPITNLELKITIDETIREFK